MDTENRHSETLPAAVEISSPLVQLPNTYRAFYGAFAQLHSAQERAIAPLLEGRDLVLQSATGSGKTEAVLAPCLERVIQSGRAQTVLYLVPTRALAMDLERRLTPILSERLGLRLGVRTGDIKRRGGRAPDLLVTTPESLDVMLGSGNAEVRHFISRVGTVVIDEVHPLVHHYRGRQLVYLLQRLERRAGRMVQKVALSATIADVEEVVRFFGFRADTERIGASVERDIAPHFVYLKNDERELAALLDDLYEAWDYRKVLLFANSRACCDRLYSILRDQGRFRGATELHYSNLKPKERRGVEHRFRSRRRALCIATSTLELGIDIGDVDGVLLYEPPDSVAAFLQRIGRGNRRSTRAQFWGICRGSEAQMQVVRFLALLALARRGAVEAARPRQLPSVLVQQILSCLYEKKRVGSEALAELFPEDRENIERLFSVMAQAGWLRQDRVKGLYRGGWRYLEAWLERRIWGNFPPGEDDFVLNFAGEAIADLPRSVVRQLEAGDRVQLAGKRLQVLRVEDGAQRQVLAHPAERLDGKELFWLGAGFRVSYEVAQEMRAVLGDEIDLQGQGLFARPRTLLQEGRSRAARVVELANGMQVGREADGLYRYWTYLGSVGNLMLEYTLEREVGARLDDFSARGDATGVNCSHWVDFQSLALPADRETLAQWVEVHLEALCGLFALNAYWTVLPQDMQVAELVDTLFDERVAKVFARYLTQSVEIVAGDRALLELGETTPVPQESVWLDPVPGAPALLEWEKRRWQGGGSAPLADGWYARALTGTLVGGYFRHRQCQRWLRLNFVPPAQRPAGWDEDEMEWTGQRLARGRAHEQRVVDELEARGEVLIFVREVDAAGRRRTLNERFEDSLKHLKDLIQGVEAEPESTFALVQAALILPGALGETGGETDEVDGVGIADLIRVSMGASGPLLEVGDIKDSRTARESQKWQVAFYALLLEALIDRGALPQRAAVAPSGFLLLQALPGSEAAQIHAFDLGPYLDAFPQLLRNVRAGLSQAPAEVDYQLQSHCVGCPNFKACYGEVVDREDILLLPQLTAGALEKCRMLGLATIEAAGAFFESASPAAAAFESVSPAVAAFESASPAVADFESASPVVTDLFDPKQRATLAQRIAALQMQRIGVRESQTRLFPDNLSTAIFIHCLEDPAVGRLCGVGWRALRDGEWVGGEVHYVTKDDDELVQEEVRYVADEDDELVQEEVRYVVDENDELVQGEIRYVADEDDEEAVLAAFVESFMRLWDQGVAGGRGPHVFHFGQRSQQALQEWAGATDLAFLWALDRCHLTDLQRLLSAHFAWPAPGNLTLSALGRLLGLAPQLEEPESVFHGDDAAWSAAVAQRSEEVARRATIAHLDAVLTLQVGAWRWATAHLDSAWRQTRWEKALEPVAAEKAYLDFLEEERRLREEDVLALQALPLAERVERFRALGPLDFEATALDEEGRFCYAFRRDPELGLAKFREGDFLKLAPLGSADVQQGFSVILAERSGGQIRVYSRQGRLALSRQVKYSLEEDLTDWNGPKLAHAVRTVFSPERSHRLAALFEGRWSVEDDAEGARWARDWLRKFGPIAGLNAAQQRALALPCGGSLGLIEGPPGTGKTQLLAWTLIALVLRAQEMGVPLCIAVSALTHQAIDQVLSRVAGLAAQLEPDFPGQCFKLGRQEAEAEGVLALEDVEMLKAAPYAIVGATGFGLYQLFEGQQGAFPQVFDWVVFDEASQVLAPQALLSLLYGKGRFLFYGDVKQLPPVVLGDCEVEDNGARVRDSVLAQLLHLYGPAHSVRLDQTYRMSRDLCAFPSQMWYDGMLQAAPGNAAQRLALAGRRRGDWIDGVLEPDKPVALVLAEHRGRRQQADEEVEIVTDLAYRLMVDHGLGADQLALISPHRAQNNATAERLERLLAEKALPLPLIDTVERVQGAERDAIIFAFTASDLEAIESPFLNNANRFNVALTRARKKLIVVGSRAFFAAIPQRENALQANRCFKVFVEFCRERDCVFDAGDAQETS